MTVIASFIYRGGERAEELPLSDKPFQQVDGEFAWIGVAEPTVEEMTNLKAMFGLHPLAVEDALNGKQVPKVEVYGDQLFVIIKTAHLEGDKIAYGETCIVVGRHYIVSVRQGSAKSHRNCASNSSTRQNCWTMGLITSCTGSSTSLSTVTFQWSRRWKTRCLRWKSTC